MNIVLFLAWLLPQSALAQMPNPEPMNSSCKTMHALIDNASAEIMILKTWSQLAEGGKEAAWSIEVCPRNCRTAWEAMKLAPAVPSGGTVYYSPKGNVQLQLLNVNRFEEFRAEVKAKCGSGIKSISSSAYRTQFNKKQNLCLKDFLLQKEYSFWNFNSFSISALKKAGGKEFKDFYPICAAEIKKLKPISGTATPLPTPGPRGKK